MSDFELALAIIGEQEKMLKEKDRKIEYLYQAYDLMEVIEKETLIKLRIQIEENNRLKIELEHTLNRDPPPYHPPPPYNST